MAEIRVPRKCTLCGHWVKAGDKAILIATVKTTAEDSYRTVGKKAGLRINFYADSPRSLQHIECPSDRKSSKTT